MPSLNEANIRHLLRRTEFVDRPDRVTRLLGLGSMEACVDDVLDVDTSPPSASFQGIGETWHKGRRLTEHWFHRMVTAPRPFGERMAMFWHGHIPSELGKVNSAELMREQIDTWRTSGVTGDVTTVVKAISIQGAMLRYLDNDRNFANSPNQNFARELMELFLLGVGNYREADVEAATAAWSGHTVDWRTGVYSFLPPAPASRPWEAGHDPAPQTFLGRTINGGSRPHADAGFETIEVILGTGPLGAGIIPIGPNTGRSSAEVAAEFLTLALWQEFAEADTGTVPGAVMAAMRAALVDNGFAIRPWVRTMLLRDEFYSSTAMNGLVRQPVDYAIALHVATGLDPLRGVPVWLLDRAGQVPLYPPNVSGWRPNGYWVNASAMEARNTMVQDAIWSLTGDTWDGDAGFIDLPGGRITRADMYADTPDTFVDRLIAALELRVTASLRTACIAHLEHPDIASWNRLDALMLLLLAPEMHVA